MTIAGGIGREQFPPFASAGWGMTMAFPTVESALLPDVDDMGGEGGGRR
jgi:hypothetical protein